MDGLGLPASTPILSSLPVSPKGGWLGMDGALVRIGGAYLAIDFCSYAAQRIYEEASG